MYFSVSVTLVILLKPSFGLITPIKEFRLRDLLKKSNWKSTSSSASRWGCSAPGLVVSQAFSNCSEWNSWTTHKKSTLREQQFEFCVLSSNTNREKLAVCSKWLSEDTLCQLCYPGSNWESTAPLCLRQSTNTRADISSLSGPARDPLLTDLTTPLACFSITRSGALVWEQHYHAAGDLVRLCEEAAPAAFKALNYRHH